MPDEASLSGDLAPSPEDGPGACAGIDAQAGIPPSANGALIRLAAAHARRTGLDPDAILARAGIADIPVRDGNERIDASNQIALLGLLAKALRDPLLGFHLGTSFELRELGLLYYVMASAPTLRLALERGERYSTIANESIVPACRFGPDGFGIRFAYVGVSRHRDRHQMEFWTTGLVRIVRQLTGRTLSPIGVRLIHPRTERSGELEAYIAREIAIAAACDEIRFAGSFLDEPMRGADPYLHKILLRSCEDALGRRRPLERIRTRVENALTPLLPHGRARIGDVARGLGMSPRTLSRRLSEEGLSFAGVLTALREELARYYLTQTRIPISRVAWLVGYQEVSAFTNAFRRWTGSAPSEVRGDRGGRGTRITPAPRRRGASGAAPRDRARSQGT